MCGFAVPQLINIAFSVLPGFFHARLRGGEKLKLPKAYDSKVFGEKRKREKTRKSWWMVEQERKKEKEPLYIVAYVMKRKQKLELKISKKKFASEH